MSDLPRITVITPTLNQARYLEQTILSVLDQNYPNLEYMVVDGGSSDGSREMIEKYADRLHWWCSQTDNGRAHALNKGLDKATGDVVAYLNGGDWYLPGVLQRIGEYFRDHPRTDFVYGRCRIVDEQGELVRVHRGNLFKLEELLDLWNAWWGDRRFVQPECFWSRRIFLRVRSFREDLECAFDYEYWTRLFLAGARVERINDEICSQRLRDDVPAVNAEQAAEEELRIVEPILWNPDAPLEATMRFKLQADWLYQTRYLPEVARSRGAGESRLMRWMALGKVLLSHPKIVCFSDLYRQESRQRRGAGKSANS